MITKNLLLLLFLFNSCNTKKNTSTDIDYVKLNTWQWDIGFKIGEGDFVSFDSASLVFALTHDTIYYKGHPKAIIKKVVKQNNELIVSSIDGNNSGVYINIQEFTR
jgi:hypothetical protein